ncbi:MAG TPA: hypothetical protein DEV38_07490 [Psychrobacter sp.]|nr:hypothetical protein [Psychrobacter sp.]
MQYATVTGDRVVSTCDTSWLLDHYELHDMVNHPPHYKDASGIECIEVTSKMQFCGGNCFKYLYRAGKKGSTVEDLKKAAWYADKAWENEEVVLIAPMRLIEQVAVHREGNIKQAMLYVAEDFWAMAKRCIEAEIARLESEAVDD